MQAKNTYMSTINFITCSTTTAKLLDITAICAIKLRHKFTIHLLRSYFYAFFGYSHMFRQPRYDDTIQTQKFISSKCILSRFTKYKMLRNFSLLNWDIIINSAFFLIFTFYIPTSKIVHVQLIKSLKCITSTFLHLESTEYKNLVDI